MKKYEQVHLESLSMNCNHFGWIGGFVMRPHDDRKVRQKNFITYQMFKCMTSGDVTSKKIA